MADHTPAPWDVEIGEDRCFHRGNRVAITKSGDWDGDGEPYNVTIAELWPADNDKDIIDGTLMAAAPDMLAVCRDVLHQLSTDSDLDYKVSRPDKYDALELALREVIAKAGF